MSGKTGKAAGGKPNITVIIKKEEVVEGGHHGGAWKVAYADFVTAMMAFFLLLWLLSSTTTTQRVGLADYFTPSNLLSHTNSGSGQPFGGHTPNDEGDIVSDRGSVQINNERKQIIKDVEDDDSDTPATPVVHQAQGDPATDGDSSGGRSTAGTTVQDGQGRNRAGKQSTGTAAQQSGGGVRRDATTLEGTSAGTGPLAQVGGAADQNGKPTPTAAQQANDQAAHEQAAMLQVAQQVREAVKSDPTLAELASQLTVDLTPQGLRLQILDSERQPMFAFGSATPNDRARLILQKIAPIVAKLPERIAVIGHTDAAPYRGIDRSNWDLSADRANATRRMLIDAGVQDERFRSVTGDADRDPLLPGDPLAAANRRIAIVVLRQSPRPAGPAASPPAAPAR
jgi:chemotaxis protein MotB